MSRRDSREKALMFLYQLEIQKGDEARQLEEFIVEREVAENEKDYLEKLVSGVQAFKADLDLAISPLLKRWTLDRLPKVDLTILRIAAFELLHRSDIPSSVAISEAVLLAKKFSSEESKNYINAVLGKLSLSAEKPDEHTD